MINFRSEALELSSGVVNMIASDSGIAGIASHSAERELSQFMIASSEGVSFMSKEAASAIKAMATVANDIVL